MKTRKFDLVQLVIQPYVLKILYALNEPKRFSDLLRTVKNRRTLSIKLLKLRKYGLIGYFPMKIKGRYANSYIISEKGRKLVNKLEKF
ncbi:MAG: hypothetical protein KGH59_02785 [Candidatus Micrarchaeota archaeon]|nr:hypothetical protein [Candidatus Micrarchaeota archaeon]MDE1847196.1 hypothetical protein [Candidatus Micrarchaeota archaeon]